MATKGQIAAGTLGAITVSLMAWVTRMEGERQTAYADPVHVTTVCVGHTGPEVRPGMHVSHEQCMRYLTADLQKAGQAVARCVKVDLAPEQWDALLSFTFNVGEGAMCASSLVRKLNARDCQGAANEFPRWSRAGGRELPGLTQRRYAERSLFLKGCPDESAQH